MAWDPDELAREVLGEFVEVQDYDYGAVYDPARGSLIFRRRGRGLSDVQRAERDVRVRQYKCEKQREYEWKWAHAPLTGAAREALRRGSELRRLRRMQEKLPKDRQGVTHHFVIYTRQGEGVAEVDGYLHANVYPDGRVGEVFLKCGKEGEATAMLNQWAIAFSVALQYGAPLEAMCRKFLGARFEPSGATQNKEIPRTTSPVDYVVRYLLLKFGKEEQPEPVAEGVQP